MNYLTALLQSPDSAAITGAGPLPFSVPGKFLWVREGNLNSRITIKILFFGFRSVPRPVAHMTLFLIQ